MEPKRKGRPPKKTKLVPWSIYLPPDLREWLVSQEDKTEIKRALQRLREEQGASS